MADADHKNQHAMLILILAYNLAAIHFYIRVVMHISKKLYNRFK